MNQNRREDVWLNPRVGAYNIQAFMNLLQADGYNPLVIDGNRFTVPPEHHAAILAYVDQPAPLIAFLQSPFTPGALLNFIEAAEVGLRISPESFLAQVLHDADRDFIAEPGEGYWIDHWTYNLDLIENYLAIYPETQTSLLFETPAYTFYDNPHVVQPRARKTFLAGERVRQLDAVIYDHEKAALIAARSRAPNIMRAAHGRGEIFTTTLFAKLVTLAVVKFATRDPYGMGIEMEAGKPGWYDALNGLPGLFGASMPETFELVRLLAFLRAVIQAQDPARGVLLPVELHDLLHAIAHTLEQHSGDTFAYWDAISTARETYRAQIRLGFEGITHASTLDELDAHFAAFERRLQAGIARAAAMNDGIPPTYIAYTAEQYEIIDSAPHTPERQPVRVTTFAPQVLPLFLEGPVRALKIAPDLAAAQRLHTQVRESALFDRALQMYKVNAPLADQPLDIGRARAFTPGWLENESIWLHMAYKYLLALLKAGLYDAFYADFKSSLVPFLDPAIYGRSPLENSSFIVSSAHPDTSLHGRGFVARLSGSTAEFLSILHHIMAGPQPFALHQGDLILQFQPVLPGWLFDAAGEVHFTFLGHTRVTYVNPARCDTFGPDAVTIQQIELTGTDGRRIAFTGELIGAPHAQNVRAGRVKAIRITLA